MSLDGFRPDYLDRPAAARLRELAAHGVRARWLRPVAPTLTFPNHYTIVTGLYPAHHGIVGNSIRDPSIGYPFSIRDTAGRPGPALVGRRADLGDHPASRPSAAAIFLARHRGPDQGVTPTYYQLFDPSVPNARG